MNGHMLRVMALAVGAAALTVAAGWGLGATSLFILLIPLVISAVLLWRGLRR